MGFSFTKYKVGCIFNIDTVFYFIFFVGQKITNNLLFIPFLTTHIRTTQERKKQQKYTTK